MAQVRIIVLSKDRACQLEQLLRSMDLFLAPRDQFPITVLYRPTTAEFRRGYAVAKALHPRIDFVEETGTDSLGLLLSGLVQATTEPFLSFMVDDDVMIRAFSLESPPFLRFKSSEDISFLSLRLSPEICYNQIQGRLNLQPTISPDGEFVWRRRRRKLSDVVRQRLGAQVANDHWFWTGALSMDGDIFRTAHLQRVCDLAVSAQTVGDFEQELGKHPPPGDKGICFPRARLVNLPLNRVDQSAHRNPHQKISPEWLNGYFLQGKRLRFDWLGSMLLNSVHVEAPILWQDGAMDLTADLQTFGPAGHACESL